jgi:AGCS family alanine or glycine:cation symporter
VALLEPFIDTVVVCTMTALVIVITNNYNVEGISGVDLTSAAFATVLPWFPYILTIAVVLFAFSTMLSWSYYGLQSWMFLFGRSKIADISYKVLFCSFIVIGAAASLDAVIGFSDAMIFAMAVPNLIGLFLLLPVVREELKRYRLMIREKFND